MATERKKAKGRRKKNGANGMSDMAGKAAK